jgi:hypothetical protein
MNHMMLKEQIVTEIMSLVRQPPRKMEKPSIDELEKILNSESTDDINIEADGSISATPTTTTVGAVADKVVTAVEAEIARLREQWKARALEAEDALSREREACAAIADKHREFCDREARNGGHPSLRERAEGAAYIAKCIRERTVTRLAKAGETT